MRFSPWAEFGGKTKYLEPARIRTWNLLIRSQTRYPLRHRSNYFDKLKLAFGPFLIPVYPIYYKVGQALHWRKLRHTFHNKCSPKLIIVISHEGQGTWVYTRLQHRSQRNWTIPAKTHTAVCRCQWGSQSIPGSGPWVLENFFSDFSHHNFALWTYLMENYVPRVVWTFHDEHGQGTVALLTLLWTGWGISSNGRALA